MSANNDFNAVNNIEDICELTPTQWGLMFHSLYDPESAAYLEQVVCVIHGNLDQARLRRAFEMVMERHGVLRNSFHWRGLSKPLQIVMKHVELPWRSEDWRSLKTAEQRRRADAWIAADRNLTFNLNTAPIMRCSLIQLSDQSYRLMWTFHHLLIDGWSMPIVFKDLFEFYEAVADGRNAALPPVRPYRDYILWRQSHRDPESPAFWREYLAGITIPASITRNLVAHSAYGEYRRQLPDSIVQKLREFARVHHLTPYVVVSSALAFVLARWSGQPEVIFGSTVNGRPPELENAEAMVGLFINVIPIRVSLAFGDTILATLSRFQEQHLECCRHSQESLVDVQGWSNVPRRVQLFELLLAFENYPAPDPWGGESVRVVTVHSVERTTYPLTVTVIPNDPFSFRLVWDERKFETTMAQAFLDHLCDVVTTIVTGSARLVGELPLAPIEQRERLLEDWSLHPETGLRVRPQECVSRVRQLARAGQRTAARAEEDGEDDRQLSTALERDLTAIWSEVLGVNSIGRTDNFFELGGHSLNAMLVISRIHEQLRVDLPLRRLFESPTVAQLAVVLASAACPRRPEESLRPLPRRRRPSDARRHNE